MPLCRLHQPSGRLAMLVCAALLGSCGPADPGEEPAVSSPNNVAQELPSLPTADPPLDRERLLLEAIRAASAFAAGTEAPAAQRELAGKRFELRMRIGCGGPDMQDEARGWRFDDQERTLRLRVTSDLSDEDPVVAAIARDRFEGVEGMWIHQPWLLTPACPRRAPRPAPDAAAASKQSASKAVPETATASVSAPAGWRVGVAQFFTPADSRAGRRKERPYETTKILEEGQKPSSQGYDFIVSGRLRALPDGKVISCAAGNPMAPPQCIVSVHIDRAWIEQPDTRELIAEWTS